MALAPVSQIEGSSVWSSQTVHGLVTVAPPQVEMSIMSFTIYTIISHPRTPTKRNLVSLLELRAERLELFPRGLGNVQLKLRSLRAEEAS